MSTAWAISTIVSLTITGFIGYVTTLPDSSARPTLSERERHNILAGWLAWETLAIACVVHACVDGVAR